MGYTLGVDVGTTRTAAAVARGGSATLVSLGHRAATIPTALFSGADGAVLVGDAAVRRAVEEPERVAREFKRRIGDPVPVLLGGVAWQPEQLLARVLRWVFDAVVTEQGQLPDAVVLTHPANWGPYKLDLLRSAAAEVGLPEVLLLPEPVGAAAWYAADGRIGVGEIVAVSDFGGGTFDIAVVRREATGFSLLGSPGGIERLGGLDFDAVVLRHVLAQVPTGWAEESTDPAVVAELAELRQRCVDAKEALSDDSVASILVQHGGVRTTVRLTRDEFESMVRPEVRSTIGTTRSVLASARVRPEDLRAVLLVGGSSRIPLVSQVVGAELGVPVALDADPKLAIAMGAALHAASAPTARPAWTGAAVAPDTGRPAAPLDAVAPLGDGSAASPSPQGGQGAGPVLAPPPEPAAATPGPGRRLWLVAAGVGVVLLAVVLGALALGGGGGDDGDGEVALDRFERDAAETTTTTEPSGDESSEGDLDPGAVRLARGDADPPPDILDPTLAALAASCFEGTLADCDELYVASEVDSPEEDYARTCGGRIERRLNGTCLQDVEPTQPLPDAEAPPDLDDEEAAALAEACQQGDLTACDDLYLFSDVGSEAEAYGATCGGRRPDDADAGACTAAFDGPA